MTGVGILEKVPFRSKPIAEDMDLKMEQIGDFGWSPHVEKWVFCPKNMKISCFLDILESWDPRKSCFWTHFLTDFGGVCYFKEGSLIYWDYYRSGGGQKWSKNVPKMGHFDPFLDTF